MPRIIILLSALLIAGHLFTTNAQTTLFGITTTSGAPNVALPSVSVTATDFQTGTSTDAAGEWELTVEGIGEGDTIRLRFSAIGYQSVERRVAPVAGQYRYQVNVSLQPAVYELDGLVVKSVRVEGEEPFTYVNIDSEELRERNIGQDMPFLLRYTPSAVVTSDAGTGFGYNGLRIRGSDATRTNVTINGVPLNDAESQGTFWVNLPDFASSVSSVQIQRGVGTSTNGAGAFGAGVHLSTLGLKEKSYATLSQSAGSFQSRRTALEFGTGLLNNQLTIDGRLSRIYSGGFIDRASANQEALYLSAGWWGKRSNLQAIVFQGEERTYQAWFGVPAQFVDQDALRTYNPAGLRSDGTFHPDQVDNYQQTHWQLHYQQALNAGWALHLAGHYTRGKGYFEEYKDREREAALFSTEADFSFYGLPDPIIGGDTLRSTDLIRRRWLDNHFAGGVFSLERATETMTLTVGGAASAYLGQHFGEVVWARYASDSEQGLRYYDADADKTDANLYGKADFQIADGLDAFFDLQIRYVDYSLEALDNSRTDNYQYTFFNPKAGMSWKAGPTARGYLSLAMAHREPGRFDFLDAAPGRVPLPERLYDLEMGWDYTWADGSLSLTGYGMYYRDQLALTGAINQDALPVRVNIPESYRIGIEVNGTWQLTKYFDLEGAAAISDNRLSSFTEFIDNWDTGQQEAVEHTRTQLAFSPPLVAHLSSGYVFIDHERARLSGRLITKYVGRQHLDNTGRKETSLDPYWFSDMLVTLSTQPRGLNKVSLSLLVRNVFDVRFSSNAWTYRYISSFDARPGDPYASLESGNTYNLTGFFPQAGRNIMVRLEIAL